MLEILKYARPLNCAMVSVSVLIGALLAGQISLPAAYAMASAFLICAAGMFVNDYFDYPIDKANRKKVYKNRGALLLSSALFFAAGIAISFVINALSLAIAVLNSAILIAYSPKIKRFPLVKNLAISFLVASGFLFGGAAIGNISIPLWLAVLAFSANTAREIAKDIEDMPGDKKMKVNTLPILAGKGFASWIAVLFIFIAIIVSPIPYVLGILSEKYLFVVVMADIIFIASTFLIFPAPQLSKKAMKLAMVVALMSFFAGIML